MFEQIKTIYYRGYIRSCNYTCMYCPFSKTVSNSEDFIKDKEALFRFYETISRMTSVETVFFLPYGEAMLYSYYYKIMADISRLKHVQRVSIQTNLSFPVDQFLAVLLKEAADLSKISLWASYHDTQIELDKFLGKCDCLNKVGIKFCVGVVGDYNKIEQFKVLKESLPEDTYFWINAMEGKGVRYRQEEIEAFTKLDCMFPLEVRKIKADYHNCLGGKDSIFVNAEGNITSCNLSKVSLGNLYTGEFEEKTCRQGVCSCYLAYSCRKDIKELSFLLGKNQPVRLYAELKQRRAVFFDLDGTLMNEKGEIAEATITMLHNLKKEAMLFLATARPFVSAYRKCKEVFSLFSGGVFASGAELRILNSYKEFIYFEEAIPFYEKILPLFIDAGIDYRLYKKENIVYKMIIKNRSQKRIAALFGEYSEEFNFTEEEKLVSITDRKASKLCGILTIIKKLSLDEDYVTVVGNHENDIPMLSYFKNSAAVPTAGESVKNAAAYIKDISENIFFTFKSL